MSKLKGRKPEPTQAGHFKGLFYGRPGAGKTWFALQLPKPFYVDAEGGAVRAQYQERLAQAGGVYFGREDGAATFDGVIDQMKALATERHEFQTLVVDSITKLWNTEIATEQQRIADKGNIDAFGASKKPAVRQARRMLDWITKLDMNVVLVAHEIPEWGPDGKGGREQIGTMPDVYEKVSYELDLTLRVIASSQGNRIAQVAKSRILGFPEGSRFNLQVNSADVSYDEFAKRYGKAAIEKPVTPIVLATPAQIAEIERLVSILKIDESDIDKLLTKANAETWADLSTEQAEKATIWLRNKINPEESK